MPNLIIKIFVFLFFISQTSVFAASSAWTNDMSGTPTVFKVKPNSMMFCESYDITNGSCTGTNDFTFTKTMTADNGRCDIASAGEGTIACNYGPTTGMPSGVTYKFVRIELERTMWLSGSITNTETGTVSQTTCVTSTSNTNTDGNSAYGNASGIPSTQAINFMNGAGNEDYQGNATQTTANTLEAHCAWPDYNQTGCVVGSLQPLVDAGAILGTDYAMTPTYYNPTGTYKRWQSGLAAAETDFIIVYQLTTPYTTKKGIPPTVRMSFDVTNAIDAQFVKFTADDTTVTEVCTLYVGNPGVAFTVTD